GCRGNHGELISRWGRWLHRLVRSFPVSLQNRSTTLQVSLTSRHEPDGYAYLGKRMGFKSPSYQCLKTRDIKTPKPGCLLDLYRCHEAPFLGRRSKETSQLRSCILGDPDWGNKASARKAQSV